VHGPAPASTFDPVVHIAGIGSDFYGSLDEPKELEALLETSKSR
jgi:hypothetical protein